MLQRRMPGRLMGSVPLMGGGQSYLQKVQGIQQDNQILYHPMKEPSGGVAIDYSPEGNDGAYTGVTLGQPGIGDGETCPLFDGANDFNNIYSAGFNSDFDGQEGTIAAWMKVSGAGVWTDGVHRRIINIFVDANNSVLVYKNAGNNILTWGYSAGGTTKFANAVGHSEVGWLHIAMTWSMGADELKYYESGSQVGATVTGLGTWVGNLHVTNTCIGATNTAAANPWDGYLAHGAVWKVALSPAEVLKVATL